MPPFYGAARVGSVNEFENGCDIARDGACGNDEAGAAQSGQVGVGPWPGGEAAWPVGEHYDRELLKAGDRRNVEDRYRYWTMEAIRADIAARSLPFEVAVENLDHDFNIGSIVRTANAMGARRVHVVGRKRWNRRGAMVTDRYQHLMHHPDVDHLLKWARENGLVVVAIDNTPGCVPLETSDLPRNCLLLFGQEGPGVTEAAQQGALMTCSIAQFGSTRSINAGVAAGIAMHAWIRQHADYDNSW